MFLHLTMQFIISIALLGAFVGASLVDCNGYVCMFTDVVNAPVPTIIKHAIFDANTTYIGAEAFYNTTVTSIHFHKCGVNVDPNAFDTLEAVSIGCKNETYTLTCESGVVSAYEHLCLTCPYLS